MTWTTEQTDAVITRWKDGKSAGVIAKELGLGRGAVMGKLDRLGLLKTRQRDKALDGPRWDQRAQRPITLPKVSDV